MSHFSVLVITDEKPTKDSLATILQPWHEYECTGVEDQYVVDVDVTERLMELWAAPVKVLKLADGTIANRYSGQFYHPTGETEFGRDKTEFRMPDGAVEMEIPQSELSAAEGETLAKFAEDYGGWFERAGRFYDKTNPNKKWDWWMVGGRWTGHFRPHYDPDKDPSKQEKCWLCHGTGKREGMVVANGCNGCQGSGVTTTWPTQWKAMECDQLQVKDVPIGELRAEAEQKAAQRYDEFHAIRAGRGILSWDAVRAKHAGDIDAARQEYHGQQALKSIRAAEQFKWLDDPDEYSCDRAAYIKHSGDGAMATFAVVKDGQWYERGSMGWWGSVSDEKDRDTWNAQFAALIDGLPPTAWLTVVDCHI